MVTHRGGRGASLARREEGEYPNGKAFTCDRLCRYDRIEKGDNWGNKPPSSEAYFFSFNLPAGYMMLFPRFEIMETFIKRNGMFSMEKGKLSGQEDVWGGREEDF